MLENGPGRLLKTNKMSLTPRAERKICTLDRGGDPDAVRPHKAPTGGVAAIREP